MTDPLVPVTIATELPTELPVQDNVDVPEPPAILVELNVQTRVAELVVTARVTVPVKPLRGLIVIVEAPVAPTFTLTLVGLAAIEKSAAFAKVNVAVAV